MQNFKWSFYLDRGGTFTDIIAISPDNKIYTKKMLSRNPDKYNDAIIPAIKSFLENQKEYKRIINEIRIGTTIGTNALLEKKGKKPYLIITKGFKDILKIGYQNRNELFKFEIKKTEPLYKTAIEIEERIDSKGTIITEISEEEIRNKIKKLNPDYPFVILLMNSYKNPIHEKQIKNIIKEIFPEADIYLSSEISLHPKIIKRGDTAIIDAYLSPVLKEYLKDIKNTFPKNEILIMKSNGKLTDAEFFTGKDSILSGPAGGIIACSFLSEILKEQYIIGFDMGGTSTDVFFYDNKNKVLDLTEETIIANTRIQIPMLNIYSVASGGGSILKFEPDRLQVGPESAGAFPGPKSYRNGGPLTITDANLLLGRIQKDFFPKIFGKNQEEPLDIEAVKQAFLEIFKKMNYPYKNIEDLAEGFISVAIESMSSAIRKISIEKGLDITKTSLISFGGAGGQVACKLAENLKIKKIIFPYYASVLSALGLAIADKNKKTIQISIRNILNEQTFRFIQEKIVQLKQQFLKYQLHIRIFLRYRNSDYNLDIIFNKNYHYNKFTEIIKKEFIKRFGFYEEKEIYIDYLYVEINYQNKNKELIKKLLKQNIQTSKDYKPVKFVSIYFDGRWIDCPLYYRDQIILNQTFKGPCILISEIDTIIIFPGWIFKFDSYGNIIAEYHKDDSIQKTYNQKYKFNPVMLEIIQNRFQNIAEQMGVVLQKTAFSVNIKERLDFSCAIFDKKGNLISNAPHIPVHLGSMSESVKTIINLFFKDTSKQIKDSFIMNDPYKGGTHLPDVTIITPYYYKNTLIFFLASRGHHADIGGITPGSMPANAKHIAEEGVLIPPMPLLKNDDWNPELIQLLKNSKYPVRNLEQNLFDFKAQLAANRKGIKLLDEFINEFSIDTVIYYSNKILEYSNKKVKELIPYLKQYHNKQFSIHLDYGEIINIHFKIHNSQFVFDFTGTSSTNKNLFTPKSVTKSSILFFIRSLIDYFNPDEKNNIPLNEGCLKNIKIIIPENSLLNPVYPVPVAGGNVEISQKIVDLLCGLFEICASSQGTMNNISFGNQNFQYYETICGGTGAGKTINNKYFSGCDAIHSHMTNSRITDPEIIEERFPIRLLEFKIRPKNPISKNEISGGSGVIRSFLFLEDCYLSILSSNRKVKPFGIFNGSDGKVGKNQLIRNNKIISLEPICEMPILKGDILKIYTPNGGNIKKLK
ncbi:MAG: 5-oxoprolinase [Leptospiraceae bacterium]|nr:MAG: 5-oxoprolinase [Leptospiraceae bacterium]